MAACTAKPLNIGLRPSGKSWRHCPRTGPAKAGNLGGINDRARPRTGPAKEAPAACTFEGSEDRYGRQLTVMLRRASARTPRGSGGGDEGHAATVVPAPNVSLPWDGLPGTT